MDCVVRNWTSTEPMGEHEASPVERLPQAIAKPTLDEWARDPPGR